MVGRILPLFLLLLTAAATAVATPRMGVVVERATSLVVDQPAALREGDLLIAFEQRASAGARANRQVIRDALHWRTFEASGLLYAPVELDVLRGDRRVRISLADGVVELQVRSHNAINAFEAADTRLLAAIHAHSGGAAEMAYAEALRALPTDADATQRALLALHGARAAMLRFDWASGRERLAPALASVPDSALKVALLEADVRCSSLMRDWPASEAALQVALRLVERDAPGTLAHARVSAAYSTIEGLRDPRAALVRAERAHADALRSCGRCDGYSAVLTWYGDALFAMSRYAQARDAYARAVAIVRVLAPRGLAHARWLMRHARALRRSGEPELAVPVLDEALAIMREQKLPDVELALVLNVLGVVLIELGDLDAARGHVQNAAAIHARIGSDSVEAASVLGNLALIAIETGDLAQAEQHLQAGIGMMERNDQGLNLASFVATQARLEAARGDVAAAGVLLERARALQAAINPQAETLGDTYILLARNRLEQEQWDASAQAFAAAINIFEALPADSNVLAEPLAEFGYAELGLGRIERAEAYFRRSRLLFEARAPDTLRATIAMQGEGEVALARKDYAGAERHLQQALAIRQRDAPDTARVAHTLHTLAAVARGRNDAGSARTLACEAAAVLDRASLRSGGGDLGETRFRARYSEVYHDCLAATVATGDAAAAVLILERSRARGFRRALEQRRLNLASVRQREAVAAMAQQELAYERVLQRAGNARLEIEVRQRAQARAMELAGARAALPARIADSIPQLARTFASAPPDVDAMRATLAADTLFVAFSVGEDALIVLATGRELPVRALRVGVPRAELITRVQQLRSLIADHSPHAAEQFLAASDRLRQDLLGPLEKELAGAKRLLIAADGVLHDLPFAALWDQQRARFLVEQHALTFVDSLGSATQRETAGARRPQRLLAVGDATPPDTPLAAAGARGFWGGGRPLPRLPAARREVQSLAQRDPQHTHLLLGDAATEARVRSESTSATGIHLAVHAWFDRERPLDSALALHPGSSRADDDGMLQVYEIFEGMQLDADLVVLSGCDTAAGENFAGEGLLGFARAFAFAGARATVASLWAVEDDSTADLMAHFYAAREAGGDDARALQQAMVEMIRHPADSARTIRLRGVGGLSARTADFASIRAPYQWAAFQLYSH